MSTFVDACFGSPLRLLLLGLLPMLALGSWQGGRRRDLARGKISTALVGPQPVQSWMGPLWSTWRRLLATIFLVALVIASAGPRWGHEDLPTALTGRDLVLVLDTSNSMQARDVLPSRLGRALDATDALVDSLESRGGFRVAMVSFAAQARVLCPLTPDLDHVRRLVGAMRDDDPDVSVQGGKSSSSGTRIGQGLVAALQQIDSAESGVSEIILLSDGDDPADDREWQRGIDEARSRRIPIHVVGIGDPNTPSTIPRADGGTLEHGGKEVWTRLQEKPLKEIAQETSGTYVPAHARAIALGPLYLDRIAHGARADREGEMRHERTEHLAWFLWPALGFYLTLLLVERPALWRGAHA